MAEEGKRLEFELDDEDLKLFSEEAAEQIEVLDVALVQLEADADDELLQRIFRAAHTLKGSSAAIGHKKMASLTHAMESVLDALRQRRLRPSSEVVDALLNALDALRVLANEVVTRQDSGIETQSLEEELLALLENAGEEPANAGPGHGDGADFGFAAQARADIAAHRASGKSILAVSVRIRDDSPLPGIRCFQVLQELDAAGTVVATDPPRQVIEAGEADYVVRAVVAATLPPAQLQAALADISEVAGAEVREIGEDEPLGAPAPASEPRPLRPGAAPSAGEPGNAASASRRAGAGSIRIDVERLDGLMNLVGELVIDRARLIRIKDQLAAVLSGSELAELAENLEETTAHLGRITDELQDAIMRTRMLPIRSVLARLPRIVRDVATRSGKKVELVTAGEETELDRSVIEVITDPLVHILRNAVDHGIETPEERRRAGKPETGTVTVTAWNQEASIYISVKDDGRGLDFEAIRAKAVERGLVSAEAAAAAPPDEVLQYIFLPGLSTAKQVSDVSGRGVGLDIVRTNIERLNGSISVHSERGKGTEFIIQLPLTLATTKALMVVARGIVYAIPLVSVTETLPVRGADIHSVGGRRLLRLRDALLPVLELAAALGDRRPAVAEPAYIVAAQHAGRQVALLVDHVLGEQDVVVKSLGELLGARPGIGGATILGDGTLGLIVDTPSLVGGAARESRETQLARVA
ncbi:Chemotaxis protein CheA [bacterium HR29]|nr:Chemotaxis protein CheA [bacterium HR29]